MTIHTLYRLHESGQWPRFWADEYQPDKDGQQNPFKWENTFECLKALSGRIQVQEELMLSLLLLAFVWRIDSIGVALIPHAFGVIMGMLLLTSLESIIDLRIQQMPREAKERARAYRRDILKLKAVGIRVSTCPGVLAARRDIHSHLIGLMTTALKLEAKISQEQRYVPIDWELKDAERKFKEAHRLARTFNLTSFTAERFRELPYMDMCPVDQATG